MRVNLWAGRAFEAWDWRNPEEIGIGGSETAQVELARRLAARGHEVTSYAPIRDDTTDDGPVRWRHHNEADITDDGLWLIFRSPETADVIKPTATRKCYHVSQDVVYFEGCGGAYTEERCAKFARIMALSQPHYDYLARMFPFMRERLCLSSNGICTDRIADTTPEEIEPVNGWRQYRARQRDPRKLVWCSSPDRGLEALLLILQRALEYEPDLKLHVYYGFDNWDKVIAANPGCPQEAMKRRIMDLAAACGEAVVWGGRIGQSRLWRELLTANLWVYPSGFEETSCISVMEAQACGAVAIGNPYWAVGQNLRHGVFIPGDPLNDALTRARYVQWIVRLTRDQELANAIRREAMPWARSHFDWERIVDQYEAWIEEDFGSHTETRRRGEELDSPRLCASA